MYWFTIILMHNCVKLYVICTLVNNKYYKRNQVIKKLFYAGAVKRPEKFFFGAARKNYFGLLTAQALKTYSITIGGCELIAFFLEQFIPGITICITRE